MNVMDETSNLWVNSFNGIGEQILGMTTDNLTNLKTTSPKHSASPTRACSKKFAMQTMGKPDTYNDQVRKRYSVRRAGETDFASESLRLAEDISSY